MAVVFLVLSAVLLLTGAISSTRLAVQAQRAVGMLVHFIYIAEQQQKKVTE